MLKCGAIKIKHNGAIIVGQEQGIVNVKAMRKSKKEREKQKRLESAPDNPKWIGQIFGPWKVLAYKSGKGWLVKCEDCGRETYHYASRVKSLSAPQCLCQLNYGKYDGEEWVGQKHGHLTINGYADGRFVCTCDCGRETRVIPVNLLRHDVKTCGNKDCEYHYSLNYQADGLSSERLHEYGNGMKARCYNPGSSSYVTYGGRGIGICDEWREDYKAFREWALSHGYADDLSIDRIDNDKGYEPDNCRWVTMAEQPTNKRPPYTYTTQRKPRKRSLRKLKHVWTIGRHNKIRDRVVRRIGLSVPMVMYRAKQKA